MPVAGVRGKRFFMPVFCPWLSLQVGDGATGREMPARARGGSGAKLWGGAWVMLVWGRRMVCDRLARGAREGEP